MSFTGRFFVLLTLMLGATAFFFAVSTPAQADGADSRKITFPPPYQEAVELQRTDPAKEPFCGLARRGDGDERPIENLPALGTTPCVGGMADIYPCLNVDLDAFVPIADLGTGNFRASSLWGWTDPDTSREYALIGLRNGTAFVDITEDGNPAVLGFLPTHTGNDIWRELKTYQNHAYIVADSNGNHGVQIFDLTQLRNVVNPPVTFTETAHYGTVGSVHNMVINEESGFAYAVGTSSGTTTCAGGLHMINIQNPISPTFAGCYALDGYTHDAQCVIYTGPDVEHQGKEICVASNTDTVTIVDVTNKALPIQISRTGYPQSGYTHQSWFTEDQAYMVLDDELDELDFGFFARTYLWDMRDLDAPTINGTYTSAVNSIDHNQYIKGDWNYQAQYNAGFRLMDISDIENGNASEYGYFDIMPNSTGATFAGAWNVYPYFASGKVIISGIEQGLYILRPTLPSPTAVSVSDFDGELNNAFLPIVAGVMLAGIVVLGVTLRRLRD